MGEVRRGARSIPDWLALVGDSADGFPGLAGWGKRSASVVLAHYAAIDAVPDDAADWDPGVRGAVRGAAKLAGTLAGEREHAELFRTLATLVVDRDLLAGRRPRCGGPGPPKASRRSAGASATRAWPHPRRRWRQADRVGGDPSPSGV